MNLLKFGPANSKLKGLEKVSGKKVFTFSLMSGHNCPYAKDCKSMAVKGLDGKWHIEDGPDTLFRCFSASQEVLLPGVRESRQHNVDLIMEAHALGAGRANPYAPMSGLINASLPKNADIIRIHVGGDFFSQSYFDAWISVAKHNPKMHFYAYTKSLPFWLARKDTIPPNFMLTASRGGHKDKLISENGLIEAIVVGSEYEAKKLGLKIDHDDRHAALPEYHNSSFALLIHGTQPKGTRFSKQVNKFNRKKAKAGKE